MYVKYCDLDKNQIFGSYISENNALATYVLANRAENVSGHPGHILSGSSGSNLLHKILESIATCPIMQVPYTYLDSHVSLVLVCYAYTVFIIQLSIVTYVVSYL